MLKYGDKNEIPPCDVKCPGDEFENMIRKMGVVFCCEWFGHDIDSDFTKETIRILCERSNFKHD